MCENGTNTDPSVCIDICGDGVTITDMGMTYCDDGNLDDGDGCSSACEIETYWECTGGSTSTADVCSDICGDGVTVGLTVSLY